MMKKSELRKIYKNKRAELTATELIDFQKSIYQQVEKLDFSLVENIHIFLSIKHHKEIDTQPIIDFLQSKNKTIIVSKSDFKTNTLTHFILEQETELELNNWGIPEPINAKNFEVKNIDLVFVPLLISDEQNFRVGYGKGFYDRFLSECKSTVKTVGLNFFTPIKKIDDINTFDFPLDKVIYPR